MSDLRADVEKRFWWHSIDLGNGIVTPGGKSAELLRAEAETVFGPISLTGKSVLDIGAWDGFFSFEAKRRGAKRVLATDHFCWTHPRVKAKETFDLARAALKADVEDMTIDVPDLNVARVGEFDVVLFLGVFYHLIDPIKALQDIAPIVRDVLIVETHLDLHDFERPAMVFYPGAELNNDPTNWWGPNRKLIECLLRYVGFTRIDYRPHPTVGHGRGIFHASRAAR